MIKSDSLNELAAALSKAQGEMRDPEMDAKNPFFKSEYTTLGEVLRTIRPVLNKFSLSISQGAQIINVDSIVLETTLLHSSGQFLTHQYPILPVKNDPQGLGSAITYARRYSLKAILGLAEADDDGNEHIKEPVKKIVEKNQESFLGAPKITEPQAKRMYAIAKSKNWLPEEVKKELKKLGFTESKDLDRKNYDTLIAILERGPEGSIE